MVVYLRDGSAQTILRAATNQTFYLTQSQYTDTGPTSPSADPITPGTWQDSYWSANFQVIGMTRPQKNPVASGIRTRDHPLSRLTPYPLGQRGGLASQHWSLTLQLTKVEKGRSTPRGQERSVRRHNSIGSVSTVALERLLKDGEGACTGLTGLYDAILRGNRT